MKYLLFSLLTFFTGSISNFALAPWDYIFVLLFSFPLFFLVLQDIYNEKKIKNKILSFIFFGLPALICPSKNIEGSFTFLPPMK